MKSKVEACIIGSLNLGEADKLITFFSRERGKLQGIAKNARKSFRRFGAGLELFTHCALHLHEREHQEIVRIELSEILHQNRGIATDLHRMAAGSVILEFVKEFAPAAERNAPVFQLLAHTLQLLSDGEDPLFLLRIFEIKALSLLGYQPKLDHCLSCGTEAKKPMLFHTHRGAVLCQDCVVSSGDEQVRLSPGSIGFYYQVLRMDLLKVTRLKPSPDIMRELDSALSSHTHSILGRQLRSAEFLNHCKMLNRSA